MLSSNVDPKSRRLALAAAFRGIRHHRRLNQADVAIAMGVSLRTYLQLERGGGRATLDHLAAFARATACDEVALFVAVAFNAAELALHCADNKLMTIGAIQTEEFHHLLGAAVRLVLPTEAISAHEAAFDTLARAVSAREPGETWLTRRQIRPPESA